MRAKFVAGNWKMFTNKAVARQLATDVVQGLAGDQRVQVALCPPFPYLQVVGEVIQGSHVSLGAQNCYHEKEGAYTGEISPAMLVDMGCRYVILGHSERRHKMGESDAFINKKLHVALAAGMEVILCLGETLAEREAGQAEKVLEKQLAATLAGVEVASLPRLVLAYEPVWAIGTGHNATPDQAQQAHSFIRRFVGTFFSEEAAARLPIQYGGSVKPENVASLLHQPDVDGGLIGKASLNAADFLAIIKAAH